MRRLTVLLFSLLLVPLVAPTAAAHPTGPWPASIPIPVDFAPEGVAVGRRHAFFVGSLSDGDIYRGDLRSGAGALLVDNHPDDGRTAVGMEVDRRRHRLFVAGGITGRGYVYDTRDGSTRAVLDLGVPGEAFVNDVTVTRRAAYFTDTLQAKIYKVPFGRCGRFEAPETIEVSGPAAALPPPAPVSARRSSSRDRHWSREHSTACCCPGERPGWCRTWTTRCRRCDSPPTCPPAP